MFLKYKLKKKIIKYMLAADASDWKEFSEDRIPLTFVGEEPQYKLNLGNKKYYIKTRQSEWNRTKIWIYLYSLTDGLLFSFSASIYDYYTPYAKKRKKEKEKQLKIESECLKKAKDFLLGEDYGN